MATRLPGDPSKKACFLLLLLLLLRDKLDHHHQWLCGVAYARQYQYLVAIVLAR